MDDRIRQRLQGFVEQLLTEEKAALRKAKTLLEIENLATEVGDELTQLLASGDLAERAEQMGAEPEHPCPDCGRMCAALQDREPLILQARRGEIEYSEPRCHCRSCRRDFFPAGEGAAASGA